MERAAAMAPPPTVDFRAVYEAEFDYVWNSLRRLGAPSRDLEDLVHDVFVVFYRTRAGYDARRPLRPWLFGIAFRVWSDWRRRARHRLEVPGIERDAADTARPVDEQVAASEERSLVLAALATLAPERRAVFVMHEIDGFSMPEIAAVLEAPLNTLYSRLRLAREQFAAAVRRRGQP